MIETDCEKWFCDCIKTAKERGITNKAILLILMKKTMEYLVIVYPETKFKEEKGVISKG